MNRTQSMVRDIKEQVLAELERSERGHRAGSGYRAYCQLVDAVREEVLLELKGRPGSGSSGRPQSSQLNQADLDLIKQEVLVELQGDREGYEGSRS